MATQPGSEESLRAALQPAALRAALRPSRPVFADPWDSEIGMFAVYAAVSFIDPLLLWAGGKMLGFDHRWRLGVFIAAAVVGAAGIMTIVGRRRTNLSVDVLAITGWLVLGLVLAPVLGLWPSAPVAIACYAGLLVLILGYVWFVGRFQTAFLRTASWPITWTLLAAGFAFCAYRLIIYQ